jgi:hypothetical protein
MRKQILTVLKRYASGKRYTVRNVLADETLVRGDSGAIVTNLGASGALTKTLPQNAQTGDTYTFVVATAQELRVTPGAAGAVYINGAKQTDNKYISADDEGESVTLVANGAGDWYAVGAVGTWSVQG